MLRRRDDKTMVSEVGLWLMKKGIPYQRYDNLSAYLKGVLRNLVCRPTRPTTHRERQDLYKELCLPKGRESIDPLDSMTDEQLRTFFSPLTPSQGELWVDWGCE